MPIYLDHAATTPVRPEVLEAMHSTRFPRIVRRSIHLTPFGADFCDLCIPPTTAEFDALRQSVRDDSPPAGDPGLPVPAATMPTDENLAA